MGCFHASPISSPGPGEEHPIKRLWCWVCAQDWDTSWGPCLFHETSRSLVCSFHPPRFGFFWVSVVGSSAVGTGRGSAPFPLFQPHASGEGLGEAPGLAAWMQDSWCHVGATSSLCLLENLEWRCRAWTPSNLNMDFSWRAEGAGLEKTPHTVSYKLWPCPSPVPGCL